MCIRDRFTIVLADTAASKWQNPTNKYDVNADGTVTSLDLIIVINRLLANLGGPIVVGGPLDTVPFYYVDVDGNGALGNLDALQLINHLNNPTQGVQSAAALATTSVITASPPVASSSVTSPSATASSATGSSDLAPVAFALAVNQMAVSGAAATNAGNDTSSGAWVDHVASQSAASATPAASSFAADDSDSLGSDSDDWDSILSDLSGESPDKKSKSLSIS